jgi:hypothetical protein
LPRARRRAARPRHRHLGCPSTTRGLNSTTAHLPSSNTPTSIVWAPDVTAKGKLCGGASPGEQSAPSGPARGTLYR